MSHQELEVTASSAAASSWCTTEGLTKAVSRARPSGKLACKCCLAEAMPSFATVSYLHNNQV